MFGLPIRLVTAAPDLIPPPLIQQLKPGGKLVIPAGLPDAQTLILVEKSNKGEITTKEILPVRFSQLENAKAACWRKRRVTSYAGFPYWAVSIQAASLALPVSWHRVARTRRTSLIAR